VRGTLFLVEDDETERDRQLIGYTMSHSIQVRYNGARTDNIQFKIGNLRFWYYNSQFYSIFSCFFL
jgi:hypothetical protein